MARRQEKVELCVRLPLIDPQENHSKRRAIQCVSRLRNFQFNQLLHIVDYTYTIGYLQILFL